MWPPSLLIGQAATEFHHLYPELDADYVGAAVGTWTSFCALLQGFVAAVAVVIAVCVAIGDFFF